jgi:hypothetical protein
MRLWFFGLLIILVSALGVLINACSVVLLFLKQRPSLFHQLLKILAACDIIVVVCCAISYGLPGESIIILSVRPLVTLTILQGGPMPKDFESVF